MFFGEVFSCYRFSSLELLDLNSVPFWTIRFVVVCAVRLDRGAAEFFRFVPFARGDHHRACNLFTNRVLPEVTFQVSFVLPRLANYLLCLFVRHRNI